MKICLNLVSIKRLDNEGFVNTFGFGQWKLTKGNLVVAREKGTSSLYVMHAMIAKGSVNAIESKEVCSLWHRRLGHISEKGLSCLARKDALSGLKNAELEKCSHCMAGKQRRLSFKKHQPSRKSDFLELVHFDICGPLKVRPFSGAIYFITFIDDHSRKLWTYALKIKNQALEKFKQFQALVERQTGKKLKCIRTDNGPQYSPPLSAALSKMPQATPIGM